jgi:hypothetical protein
VTDIRIPGVRVVVENQYFDGGNMKRILILIACVIPVFLSCTTVNNLFEYNTTNSDIVLQYTIPPAPGVDANYNVNIDPQNPIMTIVSVGSNLVKASEVKKAEVRLYEALETADIPKTVIAKTFVYCTHALNAQIVDDINYADFSFHIDITNYGINAESYSGSVSLNISLDVRMYHEPSREIVWRRVLSVSEPVGLDFPGVDNNVSNVVTIAVLSTLSTEELARGFELLSHKAASKVAQVLQSDLYSS